MANKTIELIARQKIVNRLAEREISLDDIQAELLFLEQLFVHHFYYLGEHEPMSILEGPEDNEENRKIDYFMNSLDDASVLLSNIDKWLTKG